MRDRVREGRTGGEGTSSFYGPGNDGNWQAEYKGKTYNVMADLRRGYGAVRGRWKDKWTSLRKPLREKSKG
jgi:hypothetical protein